MMALDKNKVIIIHLGGNVNVCTKLQCSPSNSCHQMSMEEKSGDHQSLVVLFSGDHECLGKV